MGERGPIPASSMERRRRNQRTEAGESTEAEVVYVDPSVAALEAPPPDPEWHDIAKNLYDSVLESAYNHLYEPSDWMWLYTMCESMSRDLGEQFLGIAEKTGEPIYGTIPLKGASISGYLKWANALMLTVGDRRRLRLEIDRHQATDAISAARTGPEVVADRAALFEPRVIEGGKA